MNETSEENEVTRRAAAIRKSRAAFATLLFVTSLVLLIGINSMMSLAAFDLASLGSLVPGFVALACTFVLAAMLLTVGAGAENGTIYATQIPFSELIRRGGYGRIEPKAISSATIVTRNQRDLLFVRTGRGIEAAFELNDPEGVSVRALQILGVSGIRVARDPGEAGRG